MRKHIGSELFEPYDCFSQGHFFFVSSSKSRHSFSKVSYSFAQQPRLFENRWHHHFYGKRFFCAYKSVSSLARK